MKKLSWLIAFAVPVVMISCQKDDLKTSSEYEIVIANCNDAPSAANTTLTLLE